MSKNRSKNIIKEFSRFSKEYDSYSIIQTRVAKKIVLDLPKKYFKTIVDIGCGTGAMYKFLIEQSVNFDLFYALDGSDNMLFSHPENEKVIKHCFDFNSMASFENIINIKSDIIVSSSALQWAKDLDFTLSNMVKISSNFYGALFSSNTFKTLHKIAGIPSPIHSIDTIKRSFDKFYSNINYEIITYKLFFDSKKEMFGYIKKSGVSGGEKRLSISQTRKLINEYNIDYLEFEVIFINASN
jgi:malonyl-CoA O-methyltransferase